MNTSRTFLLVLLATCIAGAQDNPTPAPAAAASTPAQTEMQKWIATTDEHWQAVFKRDVTDVREAELNRVKLQYRTALEDAIKRASGVGDLDGAVLLRNEQKRFWDTQDVPEQDKADDAASVKLIRAAIRPQLAKLDRDSAVRAKALHARYDQVLAQAQTQLTQRQRIDDALLVKAKREEVAAAWITPAITAAAQQPAPQVLKATPAPPAPKPVPEKSMERFFVNKVWSNNAGTTWSFKKDGSGVRQWKADKVPFTWRMFDDALVEATGLEPGGSRTQTFFFRFVSANEAYLGESADTVTMKANLKK